MTITASAISGILTKAGFKRANRRGTSWSSGFTTETFPSFVRVWYSDVNAEQANGKLAKMAELINGRQGKKYFATVEPVGGTDVLKIVAYDETDPQQNEERKAMAQEQLTADHPAAPSIADVKKALLTYSQYDADFYGTGYKVECLEGDSRLVRVRLVEGTNASYELDRDSQIAQTLANYARVVREAGFEFQVREDEMSVIVAMPGGWDNALTEETVSTVMRSAHTPWTEENIGGYTVSPYRKGNGAVRVQHYPFRDTDEKAAYATVKRYARTLIKAGYTVAEHPSDDWALLVTVAAPPLLVLREAVEPLVAEESTERVRTALLALREAVEADEQLYSTRRAGDHSIFVMAINRRIEIFYFDGEYEVLSRLGRGSWQRFPSVNSALLNFIRDELGC